MGNLEGASVLPRGSPEGVGGSGSLAASAGRVQDL